MRRRKLLASLALAWVTLSCVTAPTAGERFNLPFATLGGRQLWADVRWHDGWRIQRHVWTGHHRLLDEGDVRRAWGSLGACEQVLVRDAGPAATPGAQELVLLVHGLGRTRFSMRPIARALESDTRRVATVATASTQRSIGAQADDVAALLAHLPGVRRVSFVTHSMGGRIVAELLSRNDAAWRDRIEVGAVAMIAPPLRGSSLARTLLPPAWLHCLVPTPVTELSRRVPPTQAPFPLLVIAGQRGKPGGWNPFVPGDDDGIVGVSETFAPGAERHLVRGIHTTLMKHPEVVARVTRFLEG